MKSRGGVVAIIAFVLIATASAALIMRMTARAIEATATEQAAEAPEIARIYLAKFGSLSAAAPAIIKHVSRTGLRVTIYEEKSATFFGQHGSRRSARAARWPEPFGPGPGGPGPGTAAGGPDHRPHNDGPPRPGDFGDGRRPSWVGIMLALVTGESMHRAPIPGGEIMIFPDPDAILGVFRNVSLALAFVFMCSATCLGFYVRGVRREALRPLYETTLALQRLARRDFSARTIAAGSASAYDDLARAYNAAVEAVSSAFAERRAAEIEMQRFIADAGHELRTPLTIVMGYLDIIDGGALTDPALAGRITTGMRTEAVRMRKLIEKLIVLARMETPTDLDARTNIDVVSLVARVIESLEPLTAEPIDVRGVPFAHVFANEDDVAEALTNIIENGIKYAPLSRIAVAIERTADRVVMSVTDRGPGMTSDEQRNAFERFYRGERRGEVTGSGLGLAIAKRAVERSNGTISVHSVVGIGTTFTIELPEMPIALVEPSVARLAHRS